MHLTKIDRIRRREMLKSLYVLERKWGVPADLYIMDSVSPNYETGKQTVNRTKYHIPRLITHSVEFVHKFEYDLSFLAANKNFTYGGFYAPGDRYAIICAKFVPTEVNIQLKDYVVLSGDRYNLQRLQKLDYHAGWILHLRHTPGEKPYQSIDRAVWSRVTPSQDVEGTL